MLKRLVETKIKDFLSMWSLTTIYGNATKMKIINQEFDINKGSIYENFIAQQLYSY